MLGKIWYAKIQLFIPELSPMADRLFSPHMQTNPKLKTTSYFLSRLFLSLPANIHHSDFSKPGQKFQPAFLNIPIYSQNESYKITAMKLKILGYN